VDLASPGYNVVAGRAKDAAAGAVLIAAFAAAVVGTIVFAPHVWARLHG
jgi:diacylglycerol kinase (ATP)